METKIISFHKHNSIFHIALISFFFLLVALQSCKRKSEIPKPDVSGITVDATLHRFEKSLMAADGKTYKHIIDSLKTTDSAFYNLFAADVLNMPLSDTTYNTADTLYKYMITDSYMNRLYDSVESLYDNVEDVEHEISQAFKYYKYYFPDSALPKLYTYIAPFVYQVVMNDSALGIELNMYMGKHFSYYSAFAANLPQYMLVHFNRQNIPVNVMRMMMDGALPKLSADATLLDNMINEGKMLYYLDLVLPDTEDSIKIGFTDAQINWCRENESNIWKFFAGEELLFSKRMQDKQRYLNDAPTSYKLPAESPGKTAVWVGWQIVRAYMYHNKNFSIHQLFNETDALKILKGSNYGGNE